MGTVNLGRVRDRVTGIEKISGNGEAGTIDTYRVSFESSNYYDFNVTNGRNGVGQIVSFSGDSNSRNDLIVRIVNNQDKILALLVKSSEQNDGYMQASFKVEKTAESTEGLVTKSTYAVIAYDPTGSQLFSVIYKQSNLISDTPTFEFTFSSGFEACLNAWCILCYNDSSTGITVDDELSDNSTNPVQNKAVTAALDLKQDTLVSGENIKTINGISLLGSGDYAFDTALNENSTNAVQNKVVTEKFEKIEFQNFPFAKTAFQGTLSGTNFSSIKNALVDIQLFGVEEDEDYFLKSYLVNFNGRTLIEIARVSDKVSVASFDTYSDVYSTSKFERYNLTMLNNSGVSGYIVFNPYLFTASYYFTNYPEYTTLDKRCLHENRTQKYIGLVNNLICIGDSLTQGYISSTYLHTNNSYPAELSRMINGVADNLGASGFTAVTMYNQILAHPNWYDFASYSYMILWLGSNGGLTTTESQEAYQNIITKALTENPNIKIFLCNVFSVDGATTNVEATNTFINSLGYPVIDMNVLPFNSKHADNTLYHPFDDTHFGDYGYFRVAEHILSSICKHISTNRYSYNLIGGSKENQPLKHFVYYEEMTDNFSVASGANITIGNQRTFIIGNLVVCNIRINASETISAGTQILNVSRYPKLRSVNANAVSYSGSYPVQFSTDGKVTTLGNGLVAGDSDIEISFYS